MSEETQYGTHFYNDTNLTSRVIDIDQPSCTAILSREGRFAVRCLAIHASMAGQIFQCGHILNADGHVPRGIRHRYRLGFSQHIIITINHVDDEILIHPCLLCIAVPYATPIDCRWTFEA